LASLGRNKDLCKVERGVEHHLLQKLTLKENRGKLSGDSRRLR